MVGGCSKESRKEMGTSVTVEKSKKGYLKFPDGTLIPLDPLPEGKFIVHNNAQGRNFSISVRENLPAYVQLIPCRCDLGIGLQAVEVPGHYRYPKRPYSVWVAA